MTNAPLEDPHDHDRKYAAIAIACVKLARKPWPAVGIKKELYEDLGIRFTPENLDRTLQWLEDNSQ
jgi:hypothetical protein